MSEFTFSIPSGESKRLLTGGKYCPDNIVVTAEVPPVVVEKDVNFYDYDGTLLYSYTLEEAQALTELPPAPTPKRDFLVFSRWNWYLTDLKSFGQNADIGALYTTTDGKTHLLIETIATDELVSVWATAGMTMDWGDGSSTESFSGSGQVQLTHTYQSAGQYWVKISGTGSLGYTDGGSSAFYGSERERAVVKEAYMSASAYVKQGAFRNCASLELFVQNKNDGQTPLFGNYTFYYCVNLKCLVIPGNYYPFGSEGFRGCFSALLVPNYYNSTFGTYALRDLNIRRLTIPKFVTAVGGYNLAGSRQLTKIPPVQLNSAASYCFYECRCLRDAVISNNTTAIPSNVFQNCSSLEEVTIGSSVATIAATVFNGCISMRVLRFLPTTPPTVANSSVLSALPSVCRVEVPAESLETYKAATNYGSIADRMVGV